MLSPRRGSTDLVAGEHVDGRERGRVLVATLACLLWLNGCETSTKLGDLFQKSDTTQSTLPPPAASPNAQADPAPTGTIANAPPGDPPLDAVPRDCSARIRTTTSASARSISAPPISAWPSATSAAPSSMHPRDLEAWIGLAASYDRLRRYDLADRAYDQAMKIAGPSAEILNNKGYSYMLRGDYRPRPRDLARSPVPGPEQSLHQEQSRIARGQLPQGQGDPVATDGR